MDELPRLLADFNPAPGIVKAEAADFFVEELPLYEPSGSGTHTYFQIEKTGLSTMQAVHELAAALNVLRRDIGYCGLKDARAVTRQWLSIEHVDPARVEALELPRIRVLNVSRHGNKLRLGHLRGNRFVVRVRGVNPDDLARLQDALAALARRGAPNYFGPQRFGGRGDAWSVGRAMIRGDYDEALTCVLGRPGVADHGPIRRARQLYDEGKFADAAKYWPYAFRDERRALTALARGGGNRRRAFGVIDHSTRRLYVSAYQSHLFNQIVAQRLADGLERLLPGDLALVHASGAVFHVDDAAMEQPRADRLEISPTGPLFGYRMSQPTGRPGELESALFVREGLSSDAFRAGPLRVKGARRPLRFGPAEAQISLGADERGSYLALRFMLPRGCYATTLLRELFATPAAGAPVEETVGEAEPQD